MQKGNDSAESTEKEKLYLYLEQVRPSSRAFNISNAFSNSIEKGRLVRSNFLNKSGLSPELVKGFFF